MWTAIDTFFFALYKNHFFKKKIGFVVKSCFSYTNLDRHKVLSRIVAITTAFLNCNLSGLSLLYFNGCGAISWQHNNNFSIINNSLTIISIISQHKFKREQCWSLPPKPQNSVFAFSFNILNLCKLNASFNSSFLPSIFK